MIVSFNMATMPERISCATEALDSIYDQADVIRMYLNNFDRVPKQFKRDKVEILQGGDLRSTGKVFSALNLNEYYFCVDDDFAYPDNYAEYMISKLNKYDDKIVVSLHGEIHPAKSDKSFFKRGTRILCRQPLDKDTWANVVGNGVSAWNTNNFSVDYTGWKYHYMDDIYISIEMQKQHVPGLVASHTGKYLRYLFPESESKTLFDIYGNDDRTQTEVADSIEWKLLDDKLKNNVKDVVSYSPSVMNIPTRRKKKRRRL